MLISHALEFVYIHVNRTGGSSFASVLEPHVDHEQTNDRANKLLSSLGLQRDPKKVHFRAHDSALAVQRRWPKEMFEAYFKFAFVRNPYSWMVSMYHRIQGTPTHRHNGRVKDMSYGEFIDFEIERAKRFQHTFVLGRKDELIVDFVGRFERLQADFDHVCERLSLERFELPKLGGRKQVDYREMYDDATRDKVARHWKKDLELFEYDFE